MSAAPDTDSATRPLDLAQALRFLEVLFADRDGVLDLRFIAPDGPVQREPVESIDAAIEAIRRYGSGRNCYAGIAMRRNASRAEGAGGAENLLEAVAATVDFDYKPDDPQGSREELETKLEGMLPPSIRLFTGGGEHAWWLFEEPLPLSTLEERERFEAIQRGICDYLGGDFRSTDAARILRIPGTTNHPDAKKLAMGRVVAEAMLIRFEPELRYPLDTFDAFEERGRAIRAQKAERIEYEQGASDGNLPPRVDQLVKRRPKLSARWAGDTDGLRDPSDSGLDLAIASLLALNGVGGAEIEAALRWRRHEIGAKAKHAGYYQTTVEKALASVHQAEDERGVVTSHTPGGAQRGNGHDPEPPQVEENAERATVALPEDRTDAGLAQTFANHHAGDVLYAAGRRRWLVWDSRRYAPDEEAVRALADESARRLLAAAAVESNPDRRKDLICRSEQMRSATRVQRALWFAVSHPKLRVAAEELDADPFALNVLNGTLDLRTGALRPHRREDRLTRLAPVTYDPAAEAPLWKAFLERVLPDPELRAFVQRAAGYSLTADTSEEVMLVCHGLGANGKSTAVETLRHAFGSDYAVDVPRDLLFARRFGDAVERAALPLVGARLATSIEPSRARLREEVVKRLTSGEPFRVRALYAESFEFRPFAKLWLGTNHKPVIGGDDDGIWRRILLVPFVVTIPEEERDKDLREKLLVELPGVLRWAVEGCLAWQRDGLQAPAIVRAATDQYRQAEDVLGGFLESTTQRDPRYCAFAGDLHAALVAYCTEEGVKAPGTKALGDRLRQEGLTCRKSHGRNVWDGIGLLSQPLAAASPGDDGEEGDLL